MVGVRQQVVLRPDDAHILIPKAFDESNMLFEIWPEQQLGPVHMEDIYSLECGPQRGFVAGIAHG
jgi:hypothetical protein